MSSQPITAAASATSLSALDALQELPESVLVGVVQLLPLASKRALRSTCRNMRSFMDVHVLHTLQLGADAEHALTPLPTVSAVAAEVWRAVQHRRYHHITCLTFTSCNEHFAQYFTTCVQPLLQHLQEVRVAGSAGTTEAVLKALLVHSSVAAGASCPKNAWCSTHDAIAGGVTGSSSPISAITATGSTVSELAASCSRRLTPQTSIHTIRCKLACNPFSEESEDLPDARYLLPVLGKFCGLRTLHLSGWALFPPEAAAYSSLSTLHALSSLAASVPPQTLPLWPSLQRLHVSRRVWDDYSHLNSLTALKSLTMMPLDSTQMQQLAACLPRTLTEFKMLRLRGLVDLKQEITEAWHLRSLARLDVPTLNVSCKVLASLLSLTILSCHSLNERPGQAGREAFDRVKAAATAPQSIHVASTGRNTAAPPCAMHSLRELHLHDSGFRSGCLPHMCPALMHLSIHRSRRWADEEASTEVQVSAAAAQVLFSGGEFSGLQSLNLPIHLLSHQAVGWACTCITSFSCAGTYLSSDFVGCAALTILPMQQVQQLSIHCLFELAYNMFKIEAGYAGDELLQAAAMCTCLKELEFHGAGVFCSEDGFLSLTEAPALRVLKLREVDISDSILRALTLVANMHSLQYLEVECRNDTEAVQLAALNKKATLELVVHVRKPYADAEEEFGETDDEELDTDDGGDGIGEGSQDEESDMEDDVDDEMSEEEGEEEDNE